MMPFPRTSVRIAAAALTAGAVAVSGGCTEGEVSPPGPLVQDGPGFYQELSWSPDGSSLLVSVLEITDGDPGFVYRIWALDPERAVAEPITDGPRDYWTSWSPDGDRIAFAGVGEGGALDLYTVGADGSDRTPLTMTSSAETQPDWSPDGSRIVFVSYGDDGRARLATLQVDGGRTSLLGERSGEVQNPEWSPDGGRIAFYETDSEGVDRIVVVGADGSDPSVAGKGLWPSWVPDGRSILYGGEGGLYRLLLPDGEPRLIVAGDVLAGELSPQANRLAYIVQDGDSVSVVVADPDGSNARTVMTRARPQW